MSSIVFKFQARWKEELVVTCSGGSFVLEMPMGVLTVYLPTEQVWLKKAPSWAKNHWLPLKEQLEVWCKENKAEFLIDETAGVY